MLAFRALLLFFPGLPAVSLPPTPPPDATAAAAAAASPTAPFPRARLDPDVGDCGCSACALAALSSHPSMVFGCSKPASVADTLTSEACSGTVASPARGSATAGID